MLRRYMVDLLKLLIQVQNNHAKEEAEEEILIQAELSVLQVFQPGIVSIFQQNFLQEG